MIDTAKTAAEDKATANPTTEDLARQVEALKADISLLTESLGEYGRATGRHYKSEAQRRASGLRREAEVRADHLRHVAEDRYDEIEHYVQENPATALGIAAGIGLLVGLMTRR